MQEGDKSIADKGVLPELVQVMTVAPEGTPDPQMVEFAIRSGLCYTVNAQPLTLSPEPQTPRCQKVREGGGWGKGCSDEV
jgi:hypothetical protein